ncbi:hypothetical protein NEUTE2DRAFT_135189 [Neurospora tetrasperma FGSC 2509]|nr:hypothetical protein NEUTE2DRAFT_135189 [Neurospora tetrasperma FGSC 2509]
MHGLASCPRHLNGGRTRPFFLPVRPTARPNAFSLQWSSPEAPASLNQEFDNAYYRVFQSHLLQGADVLTGCSSVRHSPTKGGIIPVAAEVLGLLRGTAKSGLSRQCRQGHCTEPRGVLWYSAALPGRGLTSHPRQVYEVHSLDMIYVTRKYDTVVSFPPVHHQSWEKSPSPFRPRHTVFFPLRARTKNCSEEAMTDMQHAREEAEREGHSNVSATLWCSIIRASVGRTKDRGGHSALSANSDSKLARSGNVLGAWLVVSWPSFVVIPGGGRYGVGTSTGRQPEDAISWWLVAHAENDSHFSPISICFSTQCRMHLPGRTPTRHTTQTNFRRGDALNTERKTEMEPDEHPRVARRAVTGPGARPGRESSSQMKWINADSGTLSPERLELAQPAPGRRNEV